MNQFIGRAKAPSNIALIKYMGKKDDLANLPENASISMTLDSLCTYAEVTREAGSGFSFEWLNTAPAFAGGGILVPQLRAEGLAKMEKHLTRIDREIPGILKKHNLEPLASGGKYSLKTANTFPAASGIASSASAFAAITLAGAVTLAANPEEFEQHFNSKRHFRADLAALSREGSGSSCRSFDGPFVYWEEKTASPVQTNIPELAHFVLLISAEEKSVSSSQAHQRVKTSPLWVGRAARANARAEALQGALSKGDLNEVAKLAWAECWEMHSLFHTSQPPFTYWQPRTIEVLKFFAPFFEEDTFAGARLPIVTLDAGPNVHFLVPREDAKIWNENLRKKFPELKILRDRQGRGAEVIL